MTVGRALNTMVILAGLQLLAGCTSLFEYVTPVPKGVPDIAALNGNWNLDGGGLLGPYPSLKLTIAVNGNEVAAQGSFAYMCPGSGEVFEPLVFAGQIAADGSFQLTWPPGQGYYPFVVKGYAPVAGANTWSGSFSSTSTIGCSFNQTVSFTASAIEPVNGTYVAPILTPFVNGVSQGPSPNLSATITIAQGAVTSYQANGVAYAYAPLTGTINVTGFPCFTHGTASASTNSELVGFGAGMTFLMDDGSQLGLAGDWEALSEGTFAGGFIVSGGQCGSAANEYSGDFAHQ